MTLQVGAPRSVEASGEASSLYELTYSQDKPCVFAIGNMEYIVCTYSTYD